jgi:hypothetical protein
LNMEDENPTKWILSGTCLLMSDDWLSIYHSTKINKTFLFYKKKKKQYF